MDQVAGLRPRCPPALKWPRKHWNSWTQIRPHRALALSLSLQHSDAVLMWKTLIQQEPNDAGHWTGLARSLEQAGELGNRFQMPCESSRNERRGGAGNPTAPTNGHTSCHTPPPTNGYTSCHATTPTNGHAPCSPPRTNSGDEFH